MPLDHHELKEGILLADEDLPIRITLVSSHSPGRYRYLVFIFTPANVVVKLGLTINTPK